MAKMGNITVKIRVDVSEMVYRLDTLSAEWTRMDRRVWRYRPWYERVWLTYRRKGW